HHQLVSSENATAPEGKFRAKKEAKPSQTGYISAMTAPKPTFPAPDHDHDRCAADAIRHAEQVCAGRAQKFTPIRRQVLQALLSSQRPPGAYEGIHALAHIAPAA